MFESKRKKLSDASVSSNASTMRSSNPFLNAAAKIASQTTDTGNGALKLTTSGSDFVDQFASITNYRAPRSYSEIDKDMKVLWEQDPKLTTSLTLYIRMITRVTKYPDGTKTLTTQRGQGLKHEGIFRMIWIAVNYPDVFWKNIHLFISVGSWKDIITMLSYDLTYNGWEGRVLDWKKFADLIIAGLENPETSELVKKYLPQIKSRGKCKTVDAEADTAIGKYICSVVFGAATEDAQKLKNYEAYRKLKSSGTAHTWQQLISQERFFDIDFDTVHGRALSQLVSSKFLSNNNLEDKYEAWISAKPIAKFTGYVYELFAPVKEGYVNKELKKYQEDTINKQFYGMLEVAKNGMKGENPFIVVVDTSSSMTSPVRGLKVSSYDVAKSMALYFSYLLEGKFNKCWLEFADKCKVNTWVGSNPVDNLKNDRSEAYGSTNFQSVGELFADFLKKGIPESEFPKGILCVSDGCFNRTSSNESNYDRLLQTLKEAGFSKDYVDNFKVVLWDIPNNFYGGDTTTVFEDFADRPGLFHMSGLDGSAVAFLMGTEYNATIPKTSDELFLAAMDQEVLNLIII